MPNIFEDRHTAGPQGPTLTYSRRLKGHNRKKVTQHAACEWVSWFLERRDMHK